MLMVAEELGRPIIQKSIIAHLLIVTRGKDHHNRTQTRPFVSLPERMPRPGERGQQLSPSSRLPRCFAVPPGQGKKRPSTLPCGRRTDACLGHDVVAIHSGSYWIINTLVIIVEIYINHVLAFDKSIEAFVSSLDSLAQLKLYFPFELFFQFSRLD